MTLGIWGDSITFGQGDKEGLGWVGRLRREYFSDNSTIIYNRGVGGDTSVDILKRFVVEAQAIRPDTIFFAVGTNDAKYPKGKETNNIPLDLFEKSLRELVEQGRTYTSNIVCIGLIEAVEGRKEDTGTIFSNKEIQRYNQSIKKICNENTLVFLDLSGVIDTKTDMCDMVHPNSSGYEKIYQAISQYCKIRSLIKEP